MLLWNTHNGFICRVCVCARVCVCLCVHLYVCGLTIQVGTTSVLEIRSMVTRESRQPLHTLSSVCLVTHLRTLQSTMKWHQVVCDILGHSLMHQKSPPRGKLTLTVSITNMLKLILHLHKQMKTAWWGTVPYIILHYSIMFSITLLHICK